MEGSKPKTPLWIINSIILINFIDINNFFLPNFFPEFTLIFLFILQKCCTGSFEVMIFPMMSSMTKLPYRAISIIKKQLSEYLQIDLSKIFVDSNKFFAKIDLPDNINQPIMDLVTFNGEKVSRGELYGKCGCHVSTDLNLHWKIPFDSIKDKSGYNHIDENSLFKDPKEKENITILPIILKKGNRKSVGKMDFFRLLQINP